MSYDRMYTPKVIPHRIAEIVSDAVREERERCAMVVQLYPLEGMAYDVNNQGELLRLRDTLSEACLKVEVPGQGLS